MDAGALAECHPEGRRAAMRTTRQRLLDIVEFAGLIREKLPATREAFDADIVLKFFMVKQIEIVGEAACKLDKAFKMAHPEIPWQKIEKSRHILVHDYFDVDWNVIWDIIHFHIEPLRLQVEVLLHDCAED